MGVLFFAWINCVWGSVSRGAMKRSSAADEAPGPDRVHAGIHPGYAGAVVPVCVGGAHGLIAVTGALNTPAAVLLERVGMRREAHFL